MSLVAPNEGLCDQLDYLLSAPITGVPPWLLMLWVNDDLTPGQSTVYGDLTEATFQGYSRVTLSREGWTAAVLDGDTAVSTYGTTPILWNVTGSPQTVYGYAIVTPVDPVIRYIELFAFPAPLVVGSPVGVLPRVTLGTQLVESRVGIRSRALRRASKTKGR